MIKTIALAALIAAPASGAVAAPWFAPVPAGRIVDECRVATHPARGALPAYSNNQRREINACVNRVLMGGPVKAGYWLGYW
jgi:hypothetical protein